MDNSGDNVDSSRWAVRQLVIRQADFAAAIDLVDAEAPVPWCGSWTVTDLVEHLTYVHRWAAAMARDRDLDDDPGVGHAAPAGGLRARYETAAAGLQDAFAELDPDAPTRTLIDGGTVAFWHRRQLHETLVHLWDLRTAGGLELVADAGLWADSVDEAVTVMHPRQLRLGRAAAAPVRTLLIATDADRSWTLPALPAAESAAPVTVSGSAEALALLLWGRMALADPRLAVAGDRAGLQAVLDDHFLP